MGERAVNHRDLDVYRRAFEAAMAIFELSKGFPREEQYALTDQIRRSSRSVCANLAEGWRRRRYAPTFANKLSIAEGEAAETQTWLDGSGYEMVSVVANGNDLDKTIDGSGPLPSTAGLAAALEQARPGIVVSLRAVAAQHIDVTGSPAP